jgi:threonine aldolase
MGFLKKLKEFKFWTKSMGTVARTARIMWKPSSWNVQKLQWRLFEREANQEKLEAALRGLIPN